MNNKTRNIIIVAVAVILLFLFAFFLFQKENKEEIKPRDLADTIDIDPGATKEEIKEKLNNFVKENEINISMNLKPVFEHGEGNVLITNKDNNRYPQYVTITRSDTREQIYESDGIPVGTQIKTAKLDVKLAKGEYPCVATFTQYDPETNTDCGCAAAEIIVIVK